MKANARIALRGVINYWCDPVLRAIVALYGLERRSVSSPNMVMYLRVVEISLCLTPFVVFEYLIVLVLSK